MIGRAYNLSKPVPLTPIGSLLKQVRKENGEPAGREAGVLNAGMPNVLNAQNAEQV